MAEAERGRLDEARVMLVALGYARRGPYNGDHEPWDEEARAALTAFQRDRDLPATGVVDEATYRELLAEYEDDLDVERRYPRDDAFSPEHAGETRDSRATRGGDYLERTGKP